MIKRSPIELLGAVASEVEQLQQTSGITFLPLMLKLEVRHALDDARAAATGIKSPPLKGLMSLKGRKVEHVFTSGLRLGDALVLCKDGTFVVLDAVQEGSDFFLSANQHHSKSVQLKDYLVPLALRDAGMITDAEYAAAERDERNEAAHRRLDLALAEAAAARKELDALEEATPPDQPTVKAPPKTPR